MKKNRILSLLVVFALACSALLGGLCYSVAINAEAEETKVYYVSPDAPIGTEGVVGDKTQPFNIVTLLNDSTRYLAPGDTVKVLPGNYDIAQRINIKQSGNYNQYITIENDSDTEQATLSFYQHTFMSTNRGVTIEGDFIHWIDIDVRGAGDNGMFIGGSYNIIEDSEFYDNRDSGLQLGRSNGELVTIDQWPSYNLIKNCTAHNNYDNETYGENADGFAAKLTVGYGNVFDGCISYRNSDDGWDLYAKVNTGNIGAIVMYNCVAFENGFLEYNQETMNAKFPTYEHAYDEVDTTSYDTRDGDGNGFKLGGSVMEGDVILRNCLAFNNKAHGVTDNSNPGVISLDGVTSYDNNRGVDANGNIKKESTDLEGANIDLARQTYSYNNVSRTLSVQSSKAVNVYSDAYRGAVSDSVLKIGTNSYTISGSLDADTKVGINGTKGAALTEKVFKKVAIEYGDTTVYNLTGLKDLDKGQERIHVKYRNQDGSINLGELFEIVTQPIEGVTIGACLNKTSYEEYPHFDLDNNYSQVTSLDQANVEAAKDSLYLTCNPLNCYQDFWLPANMEGVTISWTSSDTSVLEVVDKEKEIKSPSKTEFKYVIVKRDVETDKSATLTATIEANGVTATKTFEVNVKMDEPRIGNVFVTVDGQNIYSGDSFIVDHYAIATEPTISVVNGANYSGSQFVLGSQFTDEVTYMYATSKLANFVEVKEFTPSNDGVWHITHNITLNSSKETATYDYYIYVASTVADVEFTSDAKLTVNKDGYMIAGELSNVTGYIYAISSQEALTVTPENIKTLEGVESYSFTSDNINFQFSNPNTTGYNVYYALANMRGQITSEIYQDEITMLDIVTPEAFMKLAGGQKVEEEDISKTIYTLSSCLDFANVTWKAGSDAFTGYLVGNGHTIKNVTVKGSGLFTKVEGGSITNLKFDNINIDAGSAQKNGIISSVYGGNFDNIAITNVKVVGGQRTGAFIGQIFEAPVATNISRVSVINPLPELTETGAMVDETTSYYVKANGNRASSLVGFIQPSSNPVDDTIVNITNCFTQSYTWSTGSAISGIVGEFEDSKGATVDVEFKLSIRNCYTNSVLVGTSSSGSRIGGMVGYHRGGGELIVNRCLSTMTAYFAKTKVEVAQKNISGIMGNFASYGETISACATLMDEYNTNYGVTAYSINMFEGDFGAAIMTDTLGFNTEVWTLCYKEGSQRLDAPYIQLKDIACEC